jgi:hypothetical protein
MGFIEENHDFKAEKAPSLPSAESKASPALDAAPAVTPGPWTVGGHPGDDSGTNWREILAPSAFGSVYVAQALEADARLIVKAVNSHDALYGALSLLVNADNCNYERDVMRHAGLFEQARAALALVGSK